MTDEPDLTPEQPAAPSQKQGGRGKPAGEPVVIRDKRRVRNAGGSGGGAGAPPPTGGGSATPEPAGRPVEADVRTDTAAAEAAAAETGAAEAEAAKAGAAGAEAADTAAAEAATAETGAAEAEAAEARAAEAETPAEPEAPAGAGTPAGTAAVEEAETQPPAGLGAELQALRADLEERTGDLQRVTAEYANYRKRVERDRERVGEQAVAGMLSALLPVLDDLDRAREHEELPDGVVAVADHLVGTLAKFGLSAFGEKGDPFDPNRHEAVAHQTSAEVSEPTCVDVMRRGYLLGDRLLRPAMVAVADPE